MRFFFNAVRGITSAMPMVLRDRRRRIRRPASVPPGMLRAARGRAARALASECRLAARQPAPARVPEPPAAASESRALSSPGRKIMNTFGGNNAVRGITSAMPMVLRDRRRIRRPVPPGMLRDIYGAFSLPVTNVVLDPPPWHLPRRRFCRKISPMLNSGAQSQLPTLRTIPGLATVCIS